MTSAFCPGHLTCFFRPVLTADVMSTGSEGVGIKLSRGTVVHVDERTDGSMKVTMDGASSEAKVTVRTVRTLCDDRGFDITVENQLPVSQGFGMSAAGAIAAGLCVCDIIDCDGNEAYRAAHMADIDELGGMGDVSALTAAGPISIRMKAGLPPRGEVVSKDFGDNLTLIVIGGSLETKKILADGDAVKRISSAGGAAMRTYLAEGRLFGASRHFSSTAGLESPELRDALLKLGGDAAMCMLGNSVFTTITEDAAKDILGHDVMMYRCSPTGSMAVIRRA